MHPQRLAEPVLISGHGPLGFRTDLVLRPIDLPGWSIQFASMQGDSLKSPLWMGVVSHRLIPSSIELAYYVGGKKHTLRIAEHLLALREGMGLYDGVLVVVGKHGIPFTGHAGHCMERVHPVLKPVTSPTQCWTTNDTIGPIKTTNRRGFVEFVPSNTGVLQLVVSIDYPQYPGVGAQEYTWISDKNAFEEVAWTRGELKRMFQWPVHMSERLGWPHAWDFADITRMPADKWASNVVRHRGLDLLGELGLVTRTGHLSGTCYCRRAGHREVLQLIRKMRQTLVEVRIPARATKESVV